MKRLLFNALCIFCLLLGATAVVSWPWSYHRGAVVAVRGYGVAVANGGIYFFPPTVIGDRNQARTFTPVGPPVEHYAGHQLQRWKPVRILLLNPPGGESLVIANWFAALIFTVPPLLWWRSWRRHRQTHTPAFPVEGVDVS